MFVEVTLEVKVLYDLKMEYVIWSYAAVVVEEKVVEVVERSVAAAAVGTPG